MRFFRVSFAHKHGFGECSLKSVEGFPKRSVLRQHINQEDAYSVVLTIQEMTEEDFTDYFGDPNE